MLEKLQIRESLQDYKNCTKQNCRGKKDFKTPYFIILKMLHSIGESTSEEIYETRKKKKEKKKETW